eukprot:m.754699 g.754699  ORF g.754699 m.754699 type:complete len:708 (-) comp23176_c0_seq4:347-2470(-)
MDAAERRAAELAVQAQQLQQQLGDLTSGEGATYETSNNSLAKLRETNSKLKYQLATLARAVGNGNDSGGSAQIAGAAHGHDVKFTMPAEVDGQSIDVVKLLESLFSSAISAAFPTAVTTAMITRNTAKPPKGKGGKGKAEVANSTAPAAPAYQCTNAMALYKQLKGTAHEMKSPRDIAVVLIAAVPANPVIDRCEAGGPGFINIFVNKTFVTGQIQRLLTQGVFPPPVDKMHVTVDFSSPNIAKVMHVGHLRSTIIGECICRMLEFAGHTVDRVNHIGDWGTQFGMLIAHLKDKFPNYLDEAPPIHDLQAFYKESKARFDKDEEFKARAKLQVVSLQEFQPDVTKAWQLICDVSRKEFQDVYTRLDVTHTHELGESFYQSRMLQLFDDLSSQGHIENDPEGTACKYLFPGGNLNPLVIRKSDGAFGYQASDLATLRYRINETQSKWIIYVVDSGQSLHFEQIFAAARKVNMVPSDVRIDHVAFGVVLGPDHKRFKTRSGETVALKSLLDEGLQRAQQFRANKLKDRADRGQVAPTLSPEEAAKADEAIAYSCIKYADLSQTRIKDYVFSYDEMLNEKGNTAVYLINAYARIQQVLQQKETKDIDVAKEVLTTELLPEGCHAKQIRFAELLLRFPTVLNTAIDVLMPNHVCAFLYELAGNVHEFYEACQIIDRKKGIVHKDRLILFAAGAKVMEKCFDLVGLRFVDKM